MQQDLKIGQLITDDQKRDAIHVAVCPVIAPDWLEAGCHVDFNGQGRAKRKDCVGIVDPFIEGPIRPGDKFWLFLYPNSVTSLRHEWEHPKFKETKEEPKEDSPSVRWLVGFAADAGLSYKDLMEAAANYINDHDNYLCEGDRWDGFYMPDEFWDHYYIVTGKKSSGSFFACSC